MGSLTGGAGTDEQTDSLCGALGKNTGEKGGAAGACRPSGCSEALSGICRVVGATGFQAEAGSSTR